MQCHRDKNGIYFLNGTESYIQTALPKRQGLFCLIEANLYIFLFQSFFC